MGNTALYLPNKNGISLLQGLIGCDIDETLANARSGGWWSENRMLASLTPAHFLKQLFVQSEAEFCCLDACAIIRTKMNCEADASTGECKCATNSNKTSQ